jgi:hypothetical protein
MMAAIFVVRSYQMFRPRFSVAGPLGPEGRRFESCCPDHNLAGFFHSKKRSG